ncbi:MAG TPA: DNA-binding protein [Dehalococcoidia bacterium]|jgi:excisionase family DNA binding protein|nr:DNA-binding protein [Dehalococcoidia bacterium]HAS28498.1 DNA-binding protein [Dehalococcoidia bacterium]
MEYNSIEPMLTTSEVARKLNLHVNTIRRWSNQGIITAYRIGPRGDRRFKIQDVERLLSKSDITK